MKILLLTPELFLADGGIARIMRLYLKALCEICGDKGRVDSLSLNDTNEPDPRVKDYANHTLRHRLGANRRKGRFIWDAIKLGRQADLIICGHLNQLVAARFAQVFHPALRYYLVAHGIEVWRPYSLIERWALRHAAGIFCVSDFTRRQLKRFYPELPENRLTVVPNTLDPIIVSEAAKQTHPRASEAPRSNLLAGRADIGGTGSARSAHPNEAQLPNRTTPAVANLSAETLEKEGAMAGEHRSSLQYPEFQRNRLKADEGIVILSVGRLSFADAYKGFDTLIEAMPLIRQQIPQARLRIVGNGDDLERLKSIARQHDVADAVVFTGRISDEALRAEYAACDLFALPSLKEGFGLVYLEAMNHGKPCLGARAGGAPEVITDDVGALVAYGNIADLASAAIDLLRHPPDSEIVRSHAATFSFPVFQQRLHAALN